ncbi:Putative STE-domain-containing protein [Rhizopus microsporus]|nr:Putative STE-domain-containing protein [Rhizopus microsporus]
MFSNYTSTYTYQPSFSWLSAPNNNNQYYGYYNNMNHDSFQKNLYINQQYHPTLLNHLPSTNEPVKPVYSVYDPFAPYSMISPCSEQTMTEGNDYFGSSAGSSPVIVPEEDMLIPGSPLSDISIKSTKMRKAKIEKRGRRRGSCPSKVTANPTDKVFACEYKGCGKVFGRQEHVKRHVRSIHTKEKPYVCPYDTCQKRFARSDNLNQHIRTHRKRSKDC